MTNNHTFHLYETVVLVNCGVNMILEKVPIKSYWLWLPLLRNHMDGRIFWHTAIWASIYFKEQRVILVQTHRGPKMKMTPNYQMRMVLIDCMACAPGPLICGIYQRSGAFCHLLIRTSVRTSSLEWQLNSWLHEGLDASLQESQL